MITLSYSTISDVMSCGQRWVNKQIGLEKEDFQYFKDGRETHITIQEHLAGNAEIPLLSEKIPFTKRLGTAEYEAWKTINDKYRIFGKLDYVHERTLYEIKTSTKLWTQGDFHKLMQWRVYGYMVKELRNVVFITTDKALKSFKIYSSDITKEDIKLAEKWLFRGITIIENGLFKTLPDKKPCHQCVYRRSCSYSTYA